MHARISGPAVFEKSAAQFNTRRITRSASAQEVGGVALLIDSKTDRAAQWYESYGAWRASSLEQGEVHQSRCVDHRGDLVRQGQGLKDVILTVDTKTERVAVDFRTQDKRALFEPTRIVIEKMDGSLIDARDDPEKSFEGRQRETPWDDIHVIYFVGEALWTYRSKSRAKPGDA
jgi:hypothetical protein